MRGHGLFGRSVAKRTCSRRHRSLQLQGDHHVRLQRRGTARWDHPGTCATADKQAVSVRGERGRREWAPIGRAWRTGPSESGVLRDRKSVNLTEVEGAHAGGVVHILELGEQGA